MHRDHDHPHGPRESSRAGHGSGGGRRSRQRRGGPWWEDWGPEWGGPPFGGPQRGPGRRARRGDIRTAILSSLVEGPAHGYEIINRLEAKSSGMWRPSPGSVYPTLQMLDDEGLVRSSEQGGKRVYELTEEGRAAAEERSARSGGAPWEEWAKEGLQEGLRGFLKAGEKIGPLFRPLLLAMRQVAMEADSTKLDRAAEVVKQATRDLYKILAEE